VTKAPQTRTWRVVLIRNRGEFLGYVDAANAASAEVAAVLAFNLSPWHGRRLLIQERL
jgi:hypothetical protein